MEAIPNYAPWGLSWTTFYLGRVTLAMCIRAISATRAAFQHWLSVLRTVFYTRADAKKECPSQKALGFSIQTLKTTFYCTGFPWCSNYRRNEVKCLAQSPSTETTYMDPCSGHVPYSLNPEALNPEAPFAEFCKQAASSEFAFRHSGACRSACT